MYWTIDIAIIAFAYGTNQQCQSLSKPCVSLLIKLHDGCYNTTCRQYSMFSNVPVSISTSEITTAVHLLSPWPEPWPENPEYWQFWQLNMLNDFYAVHVPAHLPTCLCLRDKQLMAPSLLVPACPSVSRLSFSEHHSRWYNMELHEPTHRSWEWGYDKPRWKC